MIEVKNLVKVYKSKTGVYVKALDDISLKLPQKGMVFILGKSGSGKSTLLNVLGGLDSFDSGSILVKGKETLGFKQEDYDSYRNTYVGFIFQEYNLLEDFSVGANIGLAIELQGRKATDEEINNILHIVDLDGLGLRKPNELSGGQKQRVAIARALVKNPEIIMADEPTGALDSKTGKQIFDTLKNLSNDKLVLVVSHDKDFAMGYADRIIELSDGKIIGDITNSGEIVKLTDDDVIYTENEIIVKPQYHLTENDLLMINNYLAGKKENIIIRANEKSSRNVKFVETNQVDIYSSNEGYQLIKSRLSAKNSFKIGKTGLKYKKVKLVITIILAVIAFALFGLSDVIASYDKESTYYKSIKDSNITYATFNKEVKKTYTWSDEYYFRTSDLNDLDVKKIEELYGLEVIPVFSDYCNLDYESIFPDSDTDYKSLYPTSFSGLAEVNNDILKDFGYELVEGRLPSADNEICISSYAAELFKVLGVDTGELDEFDKNIIKKYEAKDLIGEVFEVDIYNNSQNFVVTGIIDTKFDYSKYESLLDPIDSNDTAKFLAQYLLLEELSSTQENTLHTALFVNDGYIERINEKYYIGESIDNGWFEITIGNLESNYYNYINLHILANFNNFDKDILYLDSTKTSLTGGDVIISFSLLKTCYIRLLYSTMDDDNSEKIYKEIEKIENLEASLDNASNIIDKIKTIDSDYFSNVNANYYVYGSEEYEGKAINILGIALFDSYDDYVVVDDELYKMFITGEQGYYSFVTCAMPTDNALVKKLIKGSINEDVEMRYALVNNVSYELEYIDEILEVLGKVFLYVGIFFGIFAALMLSNFIATSISYKRHDIGILRAIGARFIDVFKIFFSESLIIALINFVLSSVVTFVISFAISSVLRDEAGLAVTILNFSIRQVGLLMLVSLLVAFISTVLPVLIHASRKPINAIRDR